MLPPISLSTTKLRPLRYMIRDFYPCSIVTTMKSCKQTRKGCSSGVVHEGQIEQNIRAAKVFVSHGRETRIRKRTKIHLSNLR